MKPLRAIAIIVILIISSFLAVGLYRLGCFGGAPIRQRDLFSAIGRNDTNAVAILCSKVNLNAVSDDLSKPTPLISAVKLGYFDVVRILLDHGADPNKGDVDGLSALYYALQASPFLDPHDSDSVQIERILIEHGAKMIGKGVTNAVADLNSSDARVDLYWKLATNSSESHR
ncbi:MAG: ankyrin repeat domain-containing protein [Formivibrio sp.]|nr:ankyrin repeat domain-containing protein [Formivibrio sp.]